MLKRKKMQGEMNKEDLILQMTGGHLPSRMRSCQILPIGRLKSSQVKECSFN
jgi:hypothetical protein